MKKTHFIPVAITCLLVACTADQSTNQSCIAPLTDFAYYTGQGTPYPNKIIEPSEPWLLEATLDIPDPYLIAVRDISEKTKEFWIWDSGEWISNANPKQQLFIYKTDGSDLETVELDDNFLNFSFPIEKIFITLDNSVWMVYRTTEGLPVLGKYNDATGKILPVTKVNEIKPYLNFQTIVLLNKTTGVFWFVVPYGHIYSYDPVSDSLAKHISIEDMNPTDAIMTSDGDMYIYLLRYGSPNNEIRDALFLYSPQNESISQVSIGLQIDFYPKNLFIDHANRLWAGSFGWREPDGKWYQTIRSPLFVMSQAEPSGERIEHWVPPAIKFESPENTLWFAGRGGTYYLDFNMGEWCWVSTSSELVQSADGDLWMMVENRLYRFNVP